MKKSGLVLSIKIPGPPPALPTVAAKDDIGLYDDLYFCPCNPNAFCLVINNKPAGEVRNLPTLKASVTILSIGSPLSKKFELITLPLNISPKPPVGIRLTIYGSLPVSWRNEDTPLCIFESIGMYPISGSSPISFPTPLIADVLNEPANPNIPSSGFLIFNLSLLTFTP